MECLQQCGKTASNKFCSQKCYQIWRKQNKIIECVVCGMECGRRKCLRCAKQELENYYAEHPEKKKAKDRKSQAKRSSQPPVHSASFKKCSRCRELKHLEDFYREARNVDGRRANCKECCGNKGSRKLPRKVLAARKRERNMRLRERKISEYLSEHGSPPVCECGCGKHVNFNDKGKPNRYAGRGHHTRRDRDFYSRIALKNVEETRVRKGMIDIDKFNSALRAIKEKEGLTWGQIAERGGISREHLNLILYKKSSSKTVGREWATDFFRRLAGLPAPPTKYQLSKLSKLRIADKETEMRF